MKETKDIVPMTLSRKKVAQERKAEKKREIDRVYYQKNHEKKIAQVKERRQTTQQLSKWLARRRTDIKKTERKEKLKEKREIARAEL